VLSPFETLTSFPPSFLPSLPPALPQIMTWQAVIFGPDDTPWEGGTFKLLLEFTEDYPNKVGRERGREGGRERSWKGWLRHTSLSKSWGKKSLCSAICIHAQNRLSSS